MFVRQDSHMNSSFSVPVHSSLLISPVLAQAVNTAVCWCSCIVSYNAGTGFFACRFIDDLRIDFTLHSERIAGLLIGFLETVPSWCAHNHTIRNAKRCIFCTLQNSPFPCYVLSLLLLPWLLCPMTSNQNCFILAEGWKKQRIEFINPTLLFMLKKTESWCRITLH